MSNQNSPTDSGPTHHVAVRLDTELIARVDALAISYSQPWRRATRSDLLRVVILAGLDAEERRVREQKGGPR